MQMYSKNLAQNASKIANHQKFQSFYIKQMPQ